MKHWLVKSEPNVFSVDDLSECPDQTRWWKHVRNYQARNFMRDDMQIGDRVFFYHSNTDIPAIVGVAEIASEPYPDPDAFNPDAKYFDPKSDPENPRWFMVDVRYKRKLKRTITLAELKEHKKLAEMQLLKRGNRLSIMPVSEKHWEFILSLE